MTQKQWKERCGDVVSYQLGKPIPWEEYKKLPQHIQKTYIDDLIEKFHPTATDLSKVFGATATTVAKYLRNQFHIYFSPGRMMPKENITEFQRFLDQSDGDAEAEVQETLTVPPAATSDSMTGAFIRQEVERAKPGEMSMTEFSLTFNGKFDPNMIHNSIASMLPKGANVDIVIHCCVFA